MDGAADRFSRYVNARPVQIDVRPRRFNPPPVGQPHEPGSKEKAGFGYFSEGPSRRRQAVLRVKRRASGCMISP